MTFMYNLLMVAGGYAVIDYVVSRRMIEYKEHHTEKKQGKGTAS